MRDWNPSFPMMGHKLCTKHLMHQYHNIQNSYIKQWISKCPETIILERDGGHLEFYSNNLKVISKVYL